MPDYPVVVTLEECVHRHLALVFIQILSVSACLCLSLYECVFNKLHIIVAQPRLVKLIFQFNRNGSTMEDQCVCI